MNQYMPNYLKTKNRLLIYELLRYYKSTSRAELVRMTGMSFPTVLKVIDKMLELGIVEESDEMEAPNGAGRRGHLLCFQPRAYYAIGIEFEGRLATVGLVDLLGECSHAHSLSLSDASHQVNMEQLNHEIHVLLDIAEEEGIPVLGIGIGFPSMVNAEKNTILRASAFGITEETSFREVFPEFFAGITLPVFLDNEVNYACKGESFLRYPDSSYRSLIYITLGTGCGSGLLMEGKLWYGCRHKSGEIGHMLAEPGDLLKTDRQPPVIFEDRINLDALRKKFGIDFRGAYMLTDQLCMDIIDYLCPYLCYAITNLVQLLDIYHCILTGIIPLALGQPLLHQLQARLDSVMVSNSVHVEPATNKYTGIVGAGVTVFERCLEEMFRE